MLLGAGTASERVSRFAVEEPPVPLLGSGGGAEGPGARALGALRGLGPRASSNHQKIGFSDHTGPTQTPHRPHIDSTYTKNEFVHQNFDFLDFFSEFFLELFFEVWSTVNRSVDRSVGRSVGRSVDRTVDRSVDRSVDRAVDPSVV